MGCFNIVHQNSMWEKTSHELSVASITLQQTILATQHHINPTPQPTAYYTIYNDTLMKSLWYLLFFRIFISFCIWEWLAVWTWCEQHKLMNDFFGNTTTILNRIALQTTLQWIATTFLEVLATAIALCGNYMEIIWVCLTLYKLTCKSQLLFPPANEVWGKVIFSQACVCPQEGGGLHDRSPPPAVR